MKLNKKQKLYQIESKQNCSIPFAKYMRDLKWCCLKCTLIAATAMLTECKQNFNAQKLVTSCPSKILSVTHALSPFYSHSTSNENNSNANAYTQYRVIVETAVIATMLLNSLPMQLIGGEQKRTPIKTDISLQE